MPDAICLGELLIDFVPTVTGTDLISTPEFKKAAGGAPGNVAAALLNLASIQPLLERLVMTHSESSW
ncbi:MAG: fructokinase [Gammaproteobacteria bacterium]|jgi:fructokinase